MLKLKFSTSPFDCHVMALTQKFSFIFSSETRKKNNHSIEVSFLLIVIGVLFVNYDG